MPKKSKHSAKEEKKEFKNGKYTGGKKEEMREMKPKRKKGKR
jgi:hypothetical protein